MTSTIKSRDLDARIITPGGQDAHGDLWRIWTGDMNIRIAEISDASIDMIITDPPYPQEFAELWSDLARHAARILKPQGIVATLSGKIHVDDRMRRLGEHLHYGWIYQQPLPGQNTRILGRHIVQEWKPWLCYSNGAWPSGRITWNGDNLTPGPRNKSKYYWQQQVAPAVQLIERMTAPGDIVLDPMCGVGTYGIAALQAGRKFHGIEMDADRASTAVEALANEAQP